MHWEQRVRGWLVVCLVPFELRYTNYNTQYLYQGSVMATRLQAADPPVVPNQFWSLLTSLSRLMSRYHSGPLQPFLAPRSGLNESGML